MTESETINGPTYHPKKVDSDNEEFIRVPASQKPIMNEAFNSLSTLKNFFC